ncbi:hypothetical protein [Cellulosilyticum sp. I15G10I2]|uniref:hypothetical protein n=1 Tax=Cellulosilyticum sp. I15G10I2 TaxID=1892843 RepID=UPI00085CBA05|nr:hypothetical protein [Cellulosilyticum sp. I15G10I2]
MNNKQNILLNTGITCIFAGVVLLLYLNNLLPEKYFYEYANLLAGVIFMILFARTKNKIMLMASIFFFINVSVLFLGTLLNTSSLLARMILIPGIMLLVVYITKRKSVILTVGALLTFWGIFVFIKEPLGIYGYYFSIGSLMLFTVLAFLFIWVIERQNWPILPILIFGVMGTYLIADSLSIMARNIILQTGCILLILIGVIFIIRSLFNRHLDD